jgi:hypothetical protein
MFSCFFVKILIVFQKQLGQDLTICKLVFYKHFRLGVVVFLEVLIGVAK